MLHHGNHIWHNIIWRNTGIKYPNMVIYANIKKMDTLKEIRDAERKHNHPDYRLQRHCPHSKLIEATGGWILCRNCGWKLPDY